MSAAMALLPVPAVVGARRPERVPVVAVVAVLRTDLLSFKEQFVLSRVRLVFAVVIAMAVVVVAAVFGVSVAGATVGHGYAGQFGAAGNGAGEFAPGGPAGIAVRQSTGDVFVTDGGHTASDGGPLPRVLRFDAGGAIQASIAIDPGAYNTPGALAIDPAGSAAVYVAAVDNATGAGVVLKYSAAGSFSYVLDAATSNTTITNPAAIAVDPANGNVLVTATDNSTGVLGIDVFDSTGTFVTSFDGSASSPDGGLACAGSMAVDAAHRLYVLDPCKARVDAYDATGTWQSIVDDGSQGGPVAVTADPTSGEVFVGESAPAGLQVAHFSAGGAARVSAFGPPRIAGLGGLAVNHSSGTVYAADNATTVVERFSAFTGPTVVTTTASSIDSANETLNATIDPGATAASFHFDYGLDTTYGTSTPEVSAGSGNSAAPVSDTATGLQPNTTYHFRIVGSNGAGAITGADQTFTTAAAAPIVDGSPAFVSAITPSTATLNATVNPNGSPTTYHFQYGTTTAYGQTAPTPDGDAGAAQGDGAVTTSVSGLTPGTLYHFRIVADNGTGAAQNGADQTFSTAPASPAGATAITASAATLTATVNPHGAPTTYHFEYGTTTGYGTTVPDPDGDAGSTDGDQTVTRAITGLLSATIYHVRLVSTTSGQTTTSDDGTFTTAPAPAATTATPTAVTQDQATLNGTVDTHGLPGTYTFLVTSTSSPYAISTAVTPVPAGGGPVSATVSGLPADGTYRVRLSVTSNGASRTGDPLTFVTAPQTVSNTSTDLPSEDVDPYGCVAPVLNAYARHPRAGETITLTGTDLGLGGTVVIGTTTVASTSWSADAVTAIVPDTATGTLPVTVNCGTASNTITLVLYQAPSNAFTIKTSVKNSVATLRVTVPGAGKITAGATGLRTSTATADRHGTKTLRVVLTSAGRTALAKARSRRLSIRTTIRFTPTGGATRTSTRTITFTRKASR